MGIVLQEALLVGNIAKDWAHTSFKSPDIVEAGGAMNNGKTQTQEETFKVVRKEGIHSSQSIGLLDVRMTLHWSSLSAPPELRAAVPNIAAWHVAVQLGTAKVIMPLEVEEGSFCSEGLHEQRAVWHDPQVVYSYLLAS